MSVSASVSVSILLRSQPIRVSAPLCLFLCVRVCLWFLRLMLGATCHCDIYEHVCVTVCVCVCVCAWPCLRAVTVVPCMCCTFLRMLQCVYTHTPTRARAAHTHCVHTTTYHQTIHLHTRTTCARAPTSQTRRVKRVSVQSTSTSCFLNMPSPPARPLIYARVNPIYIYLLFTHTCLYTYIHIYMNVYIYMYVYIYIHIYIYIYIYILYMCIYI